MSFCMWIQPSLLLSFIVVKVVRASAFPLYCCLLQFWAGWIHFLRLLKVIADVYGTEKFLAIGQDACCLFSGGISNAYLPSAPSSIHWQVCCTYSCSPHSAEYTFVFIFYTELYAYHTFREISISSNIYHLPHLPFTVNFVVRAAPVQTAQNILFYLFFILSFMHTIHSPKLVILASCNPWKLCIFI